MFGLKFGLMYVLKTTRQVNGSKLGRVISFFYFIFYFVLFIINRLEQWPSTRVHVRSCRNFGNFVENLGRFRAIRIII